MRMKGDPQLESTIELIEKVNAMFDILNVRHKDEGKYGRNPNKDPYASQSDSRFQVRYKNLVGYINIHIPRPTE